MPEIWQHLWKFWQTAFIFSTTCLSFLGKNLALDACKTDHCGVVVLAAESGRSGSWLVYIFSHCTSQWYSPRTLAQRTISTLMKVYFQWKGNAQKQPCSNRYMLVGPRWGGQVFLDLFLNEPQCPRSKWWTEWPRNLVWQSVILEEKIVYCLLFSCLVFCCAWWFEMKQLSWNLTLQQNQFREDERCPCNLQISADERMPEGTLKFQHSPKRFVTQVCPKQENSRRAFCLSFVCLGL